MGGHVPNDMYSQLAFTLDPETWIIDKYVLVANNGGDAVHSFVNHSTLINNGNIYANVNSGVGFYGNHGSITNNAGALIKAPHGIYLDGDDTTVTNRGTVIGFNDAAVWFEAGSNHTVLNNTGQILSPSYGVYIGSGLNGGVIHNSGLIASSTAGYYGIFVNAVDGLTTVIDNQVGGIIQGADIAIQVGASGKISLTNHGTIIGDIDCNANGGHVNDVVANHGKIQGVVHLGPGGDSFNGSGGTSGGVFGEDGNDTLKGGAHKVVLNGGLGRDTLRGAAGADKFVFNATLESAPGANHDLIVDFSHVQHDKIDLHVIDANSVAPADQAFHFIGSHAFGHHNGELRYANHLLQGDTDGNGVADIEVHVNAAHLVAGDFVL